MKRSVISIAVFLPLLLAGCGDGGKTTDSGTGTGNVATFRYNMPSGGQIIDAEKGKEKWFAYAAIAGTSQNPANGLAKAHLFEDGRFLHTLQVNVVLPKNGFFYEGWLIDSKTDKRISTGHLKSLFGDARHNLSFESSEDLRAYSKVVITLEKDDGNSAPGLEVASAQLKVLNRD